MSFIRVLLAQIEAGFWFPSQGSTVANRVDSLFYLILWIAIFFFTLIVSLMTYFVIRYRRRPGMESGQTAHHNNALELTWSVIPALLIVVIFYQGFTGYLDLRTPPEESYEIQVVAKKWSWSFIYPNGYVDEHLHVPADRAVKLLMSSDDVIHSLYVPAFRVKMDIVPGRYTTAWFEPTEAGEFQLFCAEYCGTRHSEMLAKVVVHPPGEFEPWLEKASNLLETLPPAEAGKILYTRRGCVQCHSNDGTAKQGPSFKGTFGTQQQLNSGLTTVVDENYIRESIRNPQAKVRAGFQPVMPPFPDTVLKDAEITAIIEYIKSLK